ncbi:MAG: hypothetical protein AAF092_10080 [Pseudomonadota bacterium]
MQTLHGFVYVVGGTLFGNAKQFLRDVARVYGSHDEKSAIRILEAYRSSLVQDDPRKRDADLILDAIAEKFPHGCATIDDVEEQLNAVNAQYRSIGFSPSSSFRIVDEFPEPYSKRPYAAMNYDALDQEYYGITPGIVFRRDLLSPYYSALLFSHELVHSIISKNPAPRLARGFEDGLADVIGALVVGTRVFSFSECENFLIRSRFQYPQEKVWGSYRHYLMQALSVHSVYGEGGLLNILQTAETQSRTYIKEIESSALLRGIKSLSIARSDINEEIDDLFQYFIAFPQNLCVSANAFRLGGEIAIGKTLCEIEQYSDMHGLGDAYNELAHEDFLVVDDGSKITIDEVTDLIDIGALRYTIAI